MNKMGLNKSVELPPLKLHFGLPNLCTIPIFNLKIIFLIIASIVRVLVEKVADKTI